MDKVDIDGFLNNLTQDKRDGFEKFLTPENKFIMETKILKGKKYDPEILPDRKIFKANIFNRIIKSIDDEGNKRLVVNICG